MSLSFHIDFNGQCEEAFRLYADQLGGTLGLMLRFKDSIHSAPPAASQAEKILHGNLSLQGVELAGADVEPHRYEKPRGFYVLLGLQVRDQVHSAFEALRPNGQVILAPQKTFWSPCYAIVIDRFGVPWKLNARA